MKKKTLIFNSERIFRTIFFTMMAVILITGPVSASSEAETLLELNLENFDGISGIENNGTSDTIQIDMSSFGNVNLTREDVINVYRDKVSYIRKTHSMYNWVSISSRMSISDASWEDEDVTFSFWTDLNTITDSDKGKSVAEYRITYESDGSSAEEVFLLCQINSEMYNNYIWNIGYNAQSPINMTASKGWTHVVITNPVADKSGNKTVDVYINGKYKKSKTLKIPNNAVITSARLTFGATALNTMVPTDASYGNIRVHDGIITDENIERMYLDEKDIYTPLEGGINLDIVKSDGGLSNSFINYAEVFNGIDAKLTIDNTDDKAVDGTLFAALYDENGMKEVMPLGMVSVHGGEVGYEKTYSVTDKFSDIKLGDELKFFLWDSNLMPYIETNSCYIKNILMSDSGSLRVVINMDTIPAADSIIPSAFEITSSGVSYIADKSIYYPLSKELHLIIDNAYEISVPCRVKAVLKDIDGNRLYMDTDAAVSDTVDIPEYGDGIKYLVMYKDDEAVAVPYTDGTYTVKVGAVLQGDSRDDSVDIVLYRKRGNEETEIGRSKAAFTEDDYIYTLTCSLKAGDRVYAKIQ